MHPTSLPSHGHLRLHLCLRLRHCAPRRPHCDSTLEGHHHCLVPNQGTMIENGTTIKEMLHVTCYMSHVSFIAHKSQLPEQQGTMVAETALLTSTEALKNNSFAPTSFFLRISFHGELPPNLRNERIMVRHYRNRLQDLLTPF